MRTKSLLLLAVLTTLACATTALGQVAVGDRVEQPGYGSGIRGTVLEVGTGENEGAYLVKLDGNTKPQ